MMDEDRHLCSRCGEATKWDAGDVSLRVPAAYYCGVCGLWFTPVGGWTDGVEEVD